MKKFLDIICLILWTLQLGLAISHVANNKPVEPILYLIAVVIVILHYVLEVLR